LLTQVGKQVGSMLVVVDEDSHEGSSAALTRRGRTLGDDTRRRRPADGRGDPDRVVRSLRTSTSMIRSAY
jgi:hypothetical protein